jgi:hypothetical protein
MATKTSTSSKTETKTTQATTETSKPQALQAVDVAIGAGPTVAENVKTTAETWTNSETRSQEIDALQKRVQTLRDSDGRRSEIETLRKRLAAELEKAEVKGGDVRRQVTDQLIGQARKARDRVEPVVKERVEPVYRERLEPTVKRVRERI